MENRGTFQKLRPLSLLEHLSSCYDSAHLQVSSSSVFWTIYLEQGKITYASHSADPFDRLDRHLCRLAYRIPKLVTETRTQLRLMFENNRELQSIQNSEYEAICWLVSHQYLTTIQASALIEGLVKEVLESFLLVKQGTYELGKKLDVLPRFCQLSLQPLVEHCQNKLHLWQALGPQVWSPYQRPYLLNPTSARQQILPEVRQKVGGMLKGFSFYHLAALLDQDELQLAQILHPYIMNGTILLHEPHPQFEQLPKTFQQNLEVNGSLKNLPSLSKDKLVKDIVHKPLAQVKTPTVPRATSNESIPISANNRSTYTIVCVDDSPTMLKEISYFLEDESFSFVPINDPVKALMQIIRIKPDLILLDVRMAAIDGYELCRLLRNHTLFKHKPIIMVTGNTGIIDRVKARLVGASGYLTKPFTQADLLKMVFRHLT